MFPAMIDRTQYPEEYQALYAQLDVDPMEMDNQLARMPHLVQDASELATEAENAMNEASLAYDVVKAEIAEALRSHNEKITEASIERNLPLYEEIQNARRTLNQAKTYMRLCEDLVRALRIKSQHVLKTADMIMSGYMTPSAAYERRRDEIHAARQAAKRS